MAVPSFVITEFLVNHDAMWPAASSPCAAAEAGRNRYLGTRSAASVDSLGAQAARGEQVC
jgi:hypothetical protein